METQNGRSYSLRLLLRSLRFLMPFLALSDTGFQVSMLSGINSVCCSVLMTDTTAISQPTIELVNWNCNWTLPHSNTWSIPCRNFEMVVE